MPTHIEPLHRGLVTRRDPSLLNEGELVHAENARYLPGDPALHKAQSRALVGGGLHGAPGLVVPMIGLGWDAPTSPNIIFKSNVGTLRYIPADPDPSSPSMGAALAPAVLAVDGNALSLRARAETVHFENEHIVLDGVHPRKVTLTEAGTPQMELLGMQRNDTPVQVAHIGVAGSLQPGWYHYWFTWYNSETDHEREGTASVDAVGRIQLTAARNNLRPFILKSAFQSARPSWADSIIIYRSPVAAQSTPSPWPSGRKIANSISISSLVSVKGSSLLLQGYTVTEGSIVANEDYYVLAIDTMLEVTLLAQPIFEILTIVIDGKPVPIGRNGGPVSAFTGDIFEESLVTNDVNDPRKARYSLAGDPEKVPDLYYINFETRDRDEILSIRALGRGLGVFMRNSVWRVNWLPRSGDEEFARGRVKELVVDGLGVVGRHLVASFSMPQVGAMLAWWGPQGPYATDLDQWLELAPQVDWNAIDGTPVALVNNIEAYRLEIYFRAPTGAGFIYYLHYHESQVAGNHLAVTGPIVRTDGVSHALAITTGVAQQLVSLDPYGSIFYESVGDEDVQMSFRTREIYLAGANNEFQTRTLLVHGTFPESAASWELYARPGPVTKTALLKRTGGKLSNPRVETNAEYVQVGFNDNSAPSPVKVNWVGVEWGHLGEVER